jgi:HSP20 family protein
MFSPNLNSVLDRLMTASQAMDEVTPGRPRTQLWMPPIDIYEADNAFVVEADLPGVHQENVDIQFDRNTLTISGTRAATLPSKETSAQLRVFSSERVSGTFSRSIRLPEHVDAERIAATFAAGVLKVTVPKSSQAVPRKIAISNDISAKSIQS